MKSVIASIFVIFLTALSSAGCTSSPEMQDDQWNSADEQRSRAKQAQDELSSETSGK